MKKEVILCVDDEQIVLDSMKLELTSHFGNAYLIETAESGQEAIDTFEFLKERGHPIVLVISDYIMPNMKGDALLIALHQQSPETKKILLTGQADFEGVTNAVNNASLYRYIAKPWETHDLMLTVEAAIDSYQQSQLLREQNAQLTILNAELEKKVEERTRQLSLQHTNIQSSIRYAKRIQDAFLIGEQGLAEYFRDSFLVFLPRDIVSGDAYFATRIEDHLIVSVMDCTGHGVPGAFMSLIGLNMMQEATVIRQHIRPSQILSMMHHRIRNVLGQGEVSVRDTMEMVVCAIDTRSKILTYAGSMMPLTYVEQGEVKVIKSSKIILGMLEEENVSPESFAEHEIPYHPDTSFYIYSDGYRDQFGGPDNAKFSSKRMNQMFLDIHQQPMRSQRAAILEAHASWRIPHQSRQVDDIVMMGFRI